MAQTASDLMTSDVVTVTPDTPVKEAAKLMSDRHVGALPVVDAAGALVGIATEGDLIMQDVKVHFPSYISLLDGFIYLESYSRFEQELKKAIAANVGDVMTANVVTALPDTDVESLATLMVEKHVSRVPILDGGMLVGIVAKGDIVRAIGGGE